MPPDPEGLTTYEFRFKVHVKPDLRLASIRAVADYLANQDGAVQDKVLEEGHLHVTFLIRAGDCTVAAYRLAERVSTINSHLRRRYALPTMKTLEPLGS